jgi:hypothetical protein
MIKILLPDDVFTHAFQGLACYEACIQWYFRGNIFKGICAQDIFLGIAKFTLQVIEESVGRFDHSRE